jgi:hypothetical protein
LLNDHLHLLLIWSARWDVTGAQIWACLTPAPLFHAWQMKTAKQEGVEHLEISLHLFVHPVPRRVARGLHPLEQIPLSG